MMNTSRMMEKKNVPRNFRMMYQSMVCKKEYSRGKSVFLFITASALIV
jgi:hypothetical protein